MSFIASFFSGLKAEFEWLIASLAVATGNSDATADTQTADASATSHRDDAAPSQQSIIPAISDQQADSAAPDHHQVGQDRDPQSILRGSQHADAPTHYPVNPLQTADFIIDTSDHSGPVPSPGLMPISFEPAYSDLSSISTPAGASSTNEQNFHIAPPETGSHSGITAIHSAVGEFALASLAPQMLGGFAHGHGGGGGGGGGTPPPSYNSYDGAQVTSVSATGFTLTLNYDSSVGNAPAAFVSDIQSVADFFTKYYTTPNSTHVTIDVGFGEVAGTGLGSALGESEGYYVQVPTSGNSSQFQSLQAAFNSLGGSPHVNLPTNSTGGDPISGAHQYWVTTAEGKALGFANAQSQSLDGFVGFAAGSTTFDYNPNDGTTGYDFMGVAAHEISEIMGRVTLNGAKDFGHGVADYSPLDLFHWLDNSSPASHSFSGTTGGYFSLDGSTTAAEGYKEFNTNSGGDFSDWAVSSPPDAYDWSGGLNAQAGISYADYLAVEAVGYTGNFSGSDWQTFG